AVRANTSARREAPPAIMGAGAVPRIDDVALESRSAQAVGEETGGVVVGLGQALGARYEAPVQLHVDPLPQLSVQVGAKVGAGERVGMFLLVGELRDVALRQESIPEYRRHPDGAGLVLPFGRQVVLGHVGTTAHLEAILLPVDGRGR